MPVVQITVSLPEPATALSLTALTRSDTGLTPSGVTLPLAFTNQGGGTAWAVTFTDPDPLPARYDFTYRITWPDASTSDVTSSITPGTVTTAYGTQAEVEQEYGVTNCAEDANLSDTGAGTAAVWQQKCDAAADYIDWRAGANGFTVPLTPTDNAYFEILRRAWRMLTRAYLAESRGYTQQGQGGPNVSGVYLQLKKDAEALIDNVFNAAPPFEGTGLDTQTVGAFSVIPTYNADDIADTDEYAE